MTLALCPLTPPDLATLTAMARRFYNDDGHDWDEATQLGGLKAICEGTPHGRGYLIVLDDQPIGYVVVALGFSVEVGGMDCFLDEFFIERDRRGQGLGRQALALIEEEIKKLGGLRLCLEVEAENQRARQLYKRNGYVAHPRGLLSKALKP